MTHSDTTTKRPTFEAPVAADNMTKRLLAMAAGEKIGLGSLDDVALSVLSI
jgi:hypothetical protein